MNPVDLPCPRGKVVSLSKPRTLPNPDGSLTVEVDLDLDVQVTLVFRRPPNGAIEFVGPFRDTSRHDRVHRAPYPHDVDAELVQQGQDRALDACAMHDREPQTERKGAT